MVRMESQAGARSHSLRAHSKVYGPDQNDNKKPLNQKAMV